MLIPFVAMHHMTYIRKDLTRKLKASSAAREYEKMNFAGQDLLGNIDKNTVTVDDIFSLGPVIAKWSE